MHGFATGLERAGRGVDTPPGVLKARRAVCSDFLIL